LFILMSTNNHVRMAAELCSSAIWGGTNERWNGWDGEVGVGRQNKNGGYGGRGE